jgi:CheY-like chemotaxis protein
MNSTFGSVVVVDDEPDILDLLCSLLEDEGYAVVCLRHPVLTDDLAEVEPTPRLFMLDIMLPSMSGMHLARKLRQDGYGGTPMIAMSASSSVLHAMEQSALFQHVLGKPFDLDAVLHAVQHLGQTTESP